MSRPAPFILKTQGRKINSSHDNKLRQPRRRKFEKWIRHA